MDTKKNIYIDLSGGIIDIGDFAPISEVYYGYALVKSNSTKLYFLKSFTDAPDYALPSFLCEHRDNHCRWTEDLKLIFYQQNGSCDYNDTCGIYDIKNDKIVVPPVLKWIFLIPQFNNQFLSVSPNNQLELRNFYNELLFNFGGINIHDNFQIFCSECPLFAMVSENPFSEPPYSALKIFDIKTRQKSLEYLAIGNLSNNLRYVMNTKGEEYFVNSQWDYVFSLPWKSNEYFFNRFKSDWYSLTNRIPLRRCKINKNFNKQHFKNGKEEAYLIDNESNIIIKPGLYSKILHVNANRLLVRKGTRYALSDLDGILLTDFIYSSLGFQGKYRHNRLVTSKKNGRSMYLYCGVLDENGVELVPFNYFFIGEFKYGVALATPR